MKIKLAIIYTLVLTTQFIHADAFKDSMKIMGKSLKQIQTDLKAGQITTDTLAAAQTLAKTCQLELTQVPPDYTQDADFVNPLKNVCSMSGQLVTALQSQKADEANAIVSKIVQTKNAAHDKYQP